MTVPLALLVMLLTAVGAGAWYINAQFDALNQVSTPPPEISGEHIGGDDSITIDTNPARQAVEEVQATSEVVEEPADHLITILVMGVDAREGEPIDVKVRADSLGVVVLDKEDHSCRMLSLPRDTWTLLPGYGYTKLNSALALGGTPYQQLVIEDMLEIEIDHYGLIDFSGLTRVVDAIGGITVVNDYAFTIEDATTVYPFPRGELELDGQQALMYSRYREGPDGDFGRQERQQRVVRALMREGADLDAVRVIPNILSLVEGHVRTDMGPSDMVDLAMEFQSGCTAETLETERLHGTIEAQYDDLMEEFLSFVVIDDAEIRQKVEWLTGEDE